MSNVNLQINVLTSINCIDRVDNILNTWGKGFENLVFFSDHSDLERNILQVSTRTSYDGCAEKSLNRVKQIVSDVRYDWYFFVDDDTCVNKCGLEKFINERSKEDAVAYGRMCPGIGDWKYVHGGAGILISQSAVKKIAQEWLVTENKAMTNCAGFGDLWWGFIFEQSNINLEFHDPLFCAWEWEFNESIASDIIAVHPVKTRERMEHYCNLF